jgi:LmbE family N-acetylglucosaminyl deacetylase
VTRDEVTAGTGTDRDHPNWCAQCSVVHRETIAEIDARLTLARDRRRAVPLSRLIVAPHCDDESLGCGGLIAKYPEQCTVVVLAKPDEIRMKEFDEAKSILGYRASHFLDIPDGYVGTDMAHLVQMLDELLAAIRPDEIYLPYPSMHQDHIAGYEAGIRASRLSMSEGHWFTPSVFVYDVASYDLDLYPSDLRWNTFEVLDQAHVDAKAEAVAQYASQQVLTPHPANSIRQQAESIGAARQTQWAEAYAMVRAVRR